ncbi:site-specific integrase [Mesonia oceanica]|uniref:Tyrosine recombinase XerC n=1 Tax=Mesonia oceanica TaxID=2687242 RepID=A0AC61Y891_9FLAO|nr:site-specific integrase [Mesonia oceanica]VVU99599.1 Tyrosine recombinase XerC [Mesonia oceanica]|tara:strand:+ start:1610 stop:2641 length:1032 start_codon:yes stop_codon:yes gene_type:complete
MKKTTPLLPLFEQFIKDSKTGKRLKKNGEKITQGTINNYTYVYRNLVLFCEKSQFELRLCDYHKLTKRERISEKNYWKKFYKKFTEFLYKKGCYDNYVGANIKQLRTFFNWLAHDKELATGNYQRLFYVRKEKISILVLSPDQLKFLIHNEDFHNLLTPAEQRIKDAFVFGCTTGLRFSDLYQLTSKNFEQQENNWYIKIRSKKTKTYTSIKLPPYAISIYKKYKPDRVKQTIFKPVSLFIFNRTLKEIGKKAAFDTPIEINREKLGRLKTTTSTSLRFYDKMSSHMMRRTAITTLLILGMPEHLVRKISGHSPNSSSFNRYIQYAQVYLDKEVDKVYEKLVE